jgi:hypothetical protein
MESGPSQLVRRIQHTIAQEKDAVAEGGVAWIVGHKQDRSAEALPHFAEELHRLLAGLRREIAGRFIGEEERWPQRQRPRDADALHFATREAVRHTPLEPFEPKALDELVEPRPMEPGIFAGDPQRQLEILTDAQIREQLEELKDEAAVLAPPKRAPTLGHLPEGVASELDPPLIGALETREAMEERRLARARRPHDSEELRLSQLERDPIQKDLSLVADPMPAAQPGSRK